MMLVEIYAKEFTNIESYALPTSRILYSHQQHMKTFYSYKEYGYSYYEEWLKSRRSANHTKMIFYSKEE